MCNFFLLSGYFRVRGCTFARLIRGRVVRVQLCSTWTRRRWWQTIRSSSRANIRSQGMLKSLLLTASQVGWTGSDGYLEHSKGVCDWHIIHLSSHQQFRLFFFSRLLVFILFSVLVCNVTYNRSPKWGHRFALLSLQLTFPLNELTLISFNNQSFELANTLLLTAIICTITVDSSTKAQTRFYLYIVITQKVPQKSCCQAREESRSRHSQSHRDHQPEGDHYSLG